MSLSPRPDPSTDPEPPSPGAEPLPMCEWVGFKWLMGARGRRVDVDRLQADRGYAMDCLASADALGDPAIARYARTLRQRLNAHAGGD